MLLIELSLIKGYIASVQFNNNLVEQAQRSKTFSLYVIVHSLFPHSHSRMEKHSDTFSERSRYILKKIICSIFFINI